jgi:flagellar hook-length control protein FliK
VLTGDNSSGKQDGAGSGDLKGEGQLAVGATGGKTVSNAGEARGDFEQMMSRIGSRGPVAQKVVQQIVEGARVQVENGQTKAKIFLQPPSLGKLNLQIIAREDQVKVTFFAENFQVKEIIENNLSQLRQSFVEQGLRVDNFDVFVDYQPGGQTDGKDNSFGGFRAHRGEHGKPDFDEGDARGGGRRWLSGNYRIDLFV